MSGISRLALADWRRNNSEHYARVRHTHASNPCHSWKRFRQDRDALMRNHPSSPLCASKREYFEEIAYYSYDPRFCYFGSVDYAVEQHASVIELSPEEGSLRLTRIAIVSFSKDSRRHQLNLYWINGYGGGLFLPFADATNGDTTYGGGRYLYDAIKGADLGCKGEGKICLDFNFAYNPSCSYSDEWNCPLPPHENKLSIRIEAGEKIFC